jgi:hypothetical protein
MSAIPRKSVIVQTIHCPASFPHIHCHLILNMRKVTFYHLLYCSFGFNVLNSVDIMSYSIFSSQARLTLKRLRLSTTHTESHSQQVSLCAPASFGPSFCEQSIILSMLRLVAHIVTLKITFKQSHSSFQNYGVHKFAFGSPPAWRTLDD